MPLQAVAKHPAALFAQPGGQRHEVRITRTDRHGVNAVGAHSFDGIDDERTIGSDLVHDHVRHRAHPMAPQHGLDRLEALGPTIGALVENALGTLAQLLQRMIERRGIAQVVGVDKYRQVTHWRARRRRRHIHHPTNRHGSASPARRGLRSASPKGKLSGGVQLSRRRVIVPVLRGRP